MVSPSVSFHLYVRVNHHFLWCVCVCVCVCVRAFTACVAQLAACSYSVGWYLLLGGTRLFINLETSQMQRFNFVYFNKALVSSYMDETKCTDDENNTKNN